MNLSINETWVKKALSVLNANRIHTGRVLTADQVFCELESLFSATELADAKEAFTKNAEAEQKAGQVTQLIALHHILPESRVMAEHEMGILQRRISTIKTLLEPLSNAPDAAPDLPEHLPEDALKVHLEALLDRYGVLLMAGSAGVITNPNGFTWFLRFDNEFVELWAQGYGDLHHEPFVKRITYLHVDTLRGVAV